jgi:hypothetical protein
MVKDGEMVKFAEFSDLAQFGNKIITFVPLLKNCKFGL